MTPSPAFKTKVAIFPPDNAGCTPFFAQREEPEAEAWSLYGHVEREGDQFVARGTWMGREFEGRGLTAKDAAHRAFRLYRTARLVHERGSD